MHTSCTRWTDNQSGDWNKKLKQEQNMLTSKSTENKLIEIYSRDVPYFCFRVTIQTHLVKFRMIITDCLACKLGSYDNWSFQFDVGIVNLWSMMSSKNKVYLYLVNTTRRDKLLISFYCVWRVQDAEGWRQRQACRKEQRKCVITEFPTPWLCLGGAINS